VSEAMGQGEMSDSAAQPPERRPALRASDADRERVVDILRTAAGDGRLDVEELDERVSAAYTIRTLTELEELTLDLVPAGHAESISTAEGGVVVRPGQGGTERIISIMGGHERRGRWRVGRDLLVLSIMGGAELDFQHAEVAERTTTIRVITIMGGAELRFPPGVDVQVNKFALMGGHDVKLDETPPPPGAPVFHVRLFSLMGGAEIRQGPKPKNWIERKLDQRRLDRSEPSDRELE
jgi:hypothetical protein